MKKVLIVMLAFAAASCMEKPGSGPETPPANVDVNHFQTAEAFEIPVKEGYISVVKADGVTLAEADSPMTIWVPRMSKSRAEGDAVTVDFVPSAEYPGFEGNKAQVFQVVCFEDSKNVDFDYNDLVIHVLYQQRGDIFGFGVQPVALGSSKTTRLGCAVYKGNTQIFKGLITPAGVDCRTQYFKSKKGFINTNYEDKVDFAEHQYLGSTCRNWDVSKIAGEGVARVEWYIEVDGADTYEVYALSTNHLDKSFTKEGMPLGLVITTTGTVYNDKNGDYECGFDWFNYPREGTHIREVYPELWDWLTSDHVYDFSAIYDGYNPPAKAFPACDLGLYEASTMNVTIEKFRQN